MNITHWNPESDGELTLKSLAEKLDALGYSAHKYVYPPGTYFGPHTHDVDKIDAVLEGEFLIKTPDGDAILRAGDRLEVPRGLVHSAEVVGSKPVVSLDAIKRT